MKSRRMRRELSTVQTMIGIYCRDHHSGKGGALCHECSELASYAAKRLNRCPFQENKTTCGNCKVHCYAPDKRERIREVMRYAGPRMTYQHPILAFFHVIDGFRRSAPPRRPPKA